MQVVILCGGKGTRAYPATREVPKALLRVANEPILVHLMRLFTDQGHSNFVLSLGYLKETIIEYFRNAGEMDAYESLEMIDTGVEADTGERVKRCRHLLNERFMVTYADGICDVALDKLLEFHESHGGLATITTVPLPSQYGTVDVDEQGQVLSFREKPILRSHWINAGFFIFEPTVFEYWEGANLEREVLPQLAARGLLYAYQHDGFFKSMDTYKDQQELDQLFLTGMIPRAECLTGVRRQVNGISVPTLEPKHTAVPCSGTIRVFS
jgi:glucose-1-phosphate cytidylyltransferase